MNSCLPFVAMRSQKRCKTDPGTREASQDPSPRPGVRRLRSEANFLDDRFDTLREFSDPELLEELERRRCQFLQNLDGKCLSSDELEEVDGETITAILPEDGWLFEASEEPFTVRRWRHSPDHELDQVHLAASMAINWGVAVANSKGLKGRGDSTLGQDNFLVAKLSMGWKAACVFDGHGNQGHWPSQRIAQTMAYFLNQEPCATQLKLGDGRSALTSAFRSAQEELEAGAKALGKDIHLSGTTATVALLPPR
ncbi:unnamed protein product, partial [Effrenium voratum]